MKARLHPCISAHQQAAGEAMAWRTLRDHKQHTISLFEYVDELVLGTLLRQNPSRRTRVRAGHGTHISHKL
jgi:hypothetical protein